MDILAKLFGGQARIKIMRLFLLNNDQAFTVDDIISRSRVMKAGTRKELSAMFAMDFIKSKVITVEGSRGNKKKVQAWVLNPNFIYLEQIRDLLVDPNLLLQDDLANRLKPIGKIKLMVVSGVFIGEGESRVDIMLVVDKIKKTVLNQIIKGLESEIGKELDYVVFDTAEFNYRMSMYDKLVCDILDFPHKKLVDLGQLSTHTTKK